MNPNRRCSRILSLGLLFSIIFSAVNPATYKDILRFQEPHLKIEYSSSEDDCSVFLVLENLNIDIDDIKNCVIHVELIESKYSVYGYSWTRLKQNTSKITVPLSFNRYHIASRGYREGEDLTLSAEDFLEKKWTSLNVEIWNDLGHGYGEYLGGMKIDDMSFIIPDTPSIPEIIGSAETAETILLSNQTPRSSISSQPSSPIDSSHSGQSETHLPFFLW